MTSARQFPGAYPATRLRRPRQHAWSRRLVAEHALSPADLIWPLFVIPGDNRTENIASMPGVQRLSIDRIVAAVAEAVRLGIPAIALFPATPGDHKTEDAREA